MTQILDTYLGCIASYFESAIKSVAVKLPSSLSNNLSTFSSLLPFNFPIKLIWLKKLYDSNLTLTDPATQVPIL